MTSPRPLSLRTPMLKSTQRGVVLFIALIVMVAMSLAGIALMRSVDTTSTVIGNLAFRQASILPANYAIEDAAAGIVQRRQFQQPPADRGREGRHVGRELLRDAQPGRPAGTTCMACRSRCRRSRRRPGPRLKLDDGDNQITYVIERMCNPNATSVPADNSAAASWCDMMAPKQSPGTTINDPTPASALSGKPFYRVTVRVDGPAGTNAVSFVQAMLR